MVTDGMILTPPMSSSILPGITRDAVITLARDMGYDVREHSIPRGQLHTCDELFFTGTAVEITPIRSVDRVLVGEGKPRPGDQAADGRVPSAGAGEDPDRYGWLSPLERREPADPGATRGEHSMNINDLLKVAVERKASDLHLKVGNHPIIRVDGDLQPMTEIKRLLQEDTIAMAFSIMNARQKQRFKEEFELDIAYSVPGLGRFRCNVFQQRGAVGMVLRVIPARILSIRELMLPPVLERICDEARGLVLSPAPPARASRRRSRR